MHCVTTLMLQLNCDKLWRSSVTCQVRLKVYQWVEKIICKCIDTNGYYDALIQACEV
jgi:hypothetical protein